MAGLCHQLILQLLLEVEAERKKNLQLAENKAKGFQQKLLTQIGNVDFLKKNFSLFGDL